MRARIRNLSLGALAGVVIVAMLGAGGFPSRPKFQAVGVGVAAPSTVGQIQTSHNIIAGNDVLPLVDNSQDLGSVSLRWRNLRAEQFNSVAFADFARLSQTNTFTALQRFNGVVPEIVFTETDASADNGRWSFHANVEQFRGSIYNDAEGVATNWLVIDRTGTTVDSINLTASAVQANGVPIRPTIVCTAACNVSTLAVGQSALVVKTTDEAIATDATYTDDAVLQFLNFPVGSYSYRVGWRLEAGAGGAKAQLNFTGLATDTADVHGVRRCANGAVVAAVGAAFTTIGGENSCTGAGSSGVSYEGTFITVAATDDMFTQWAQVSSNAATTTLSARSHMHVTRLK